MKKYTIGIIFNETFDQVLLILKNRPEWQNGKYNFPGGHIEEDEEVYPIRCIAREVHEECNIFIHTLQWIHIGRMINEEEYLVEIFTTIYKPTYHGEVKTMEDQEVGWFPINNLPENTITNLKWLIPFAKNVWQTGLNLDLLTFGTFIYKN